MAPARAGRPMLSLQPDQELDRIAAGLAGSGALALLLIEAEPL